MFTAFSTLPVNAGNNSVYRAPVSTGRVGKKHRYPMLFANTARVLGTHCPCSWAVGTTVNTGVIFDTREHTARV